MTTISTLDPGEIREDAYDRANRFALLALSFIVPVQPLLPVKTWRPVEFVVIAMALTALVMRRHVHVPSPLLWSFALGSIASIVATIFSTDPKLSLDTGILEFGVPCAVFYLFLVFARDRDFLIRCMILFFVGVLLVAIVQTQTIISVVHQRFPLPVLADGFLLYKMSVPFYFREGVPDSYGNIDNFISTWVLLVPLGIGGLYVLRNRWLVWTALAAIFYTGLIVYSRSGLLAVLMATAAIWIVRWSSSRSISPAICLIMIGLRCSTLELEVD